MEALPNRIERIRRVKRGLLGGIVSGAEDVVSDVSPVVEEVVKPVVEKVVEPVKEEVVEPVVEEVEGVVSGVGKGVEKALVEDAAPTSTGCGDHCSTAEAPATTTKRKAPLLEISIPQVLAPITATRGPAATLPGIDVPSERPSTTSKQALLPTLPGISIPSIIETTSRAPPPEQTTSRQGLLPSLPGIAIPEIIKTTSRAPQTTQADPPAIQVPTRPVDGIRPTTTKAIVTLPGIGIPSKPATSDPARPPSGTTAKPPVTLPGIDVPTRKPPATTKTLTNGANRPPPISLPGISIPDIVNPTRLTTALLKPTTSLPGIDVPTAPGPEEPTRSATADRPPSETTTRLSLPGIEVPTLRPTTTKQQISKSSERAGTPSTTRSAERQTTSPELPATTSSPVASSSVAGDPPSTTATREGLSSSDGSENSTVPRTETATPTSTQDPSETESESERVIRTVQEPTATTTVDTDEGTLTTSFTDFDTASITDFVTSDFINTVPTESFAFPADTTRSFGHLGVQQGSMAASRASDLSEASYLSSVQSKLSEGGVVTMTDSSGQSLTISGSTALSSVNSRLSTFAFPPTTGTPVPTSPSDSGHNLAAKVGPIVGGVIGALAVIAAVFVFCVIVAHRRKRKAGEAKRDSTFFDDKRPGSMSFTGFPVTFSQDSPGSPAPFASLRSASKSGPRQDYGSAGVARDLDTPHSAVPFVVASTPVSHVKRSFSILRSPTLNKKPSTMEKFGAPSSTAPTSPAGSDSSDKLSVISDPFRCSYTQYLDDPMIHREGGSSFSPQVPKSAAQTNDVASVSDSGKRTSTDTFATARDTNRSSYASYADLSDNEQLFSVDNDARSIMSYSADQLRDPFADPGELRDRDSSSTHRTVRPSNASGTLRQAVLSRNADNARPYSEESMLSGGTSVLDFVCDFPKPQH